MQLTLDRPCSCRSYFVYSLITVQILWVYNDYQVQFIDEHPHCKAFLGQKPTFWQNLTFRGIKRVNWAYTCMKLRVLSHHTLKSIEGLLAVALIPKRAFIRAHLRQNPKITRRMAIVSFCNQCKAHYLATSRESRRVVSFSRVAGAGIWLRQESIRHILASPGYAPGTIAVNVTCMERGFKRIRDRHIYLQPFTSYSETLVGNCNFFPTPCI